MAEVKIIPRISCDNCGAVVDKKADTYSSGKAQTYSKPRDWGSCRIEGTRDADSYGNKERLSFTDLCPECATHIIRAAARAASERRGEYRDGGA